MTVELGEPMSQEEMEEKLTVPDGFRIMGEHIELSVVYDGETVTYRGQNGELEQVDVLCYLDHVVSVAVKQNIDDETLELIPGGTHPGVVACHMIQHLHQSMHAMEMRNQIAEGGIGGLMKALADSMDGIDPEDITAMMVGPNGEIEEISTGEIDEVLSSLSNQDDEPEEEIIIGEIPSRRRH